MAVPSLAATAWWARSPTSYRWMSKCLVSTHPAADHHGTAHGVRPVTTTLHDSPTVPRPDEGPRAARRVRGQAILSGGLTAVLGAVGVALGLSAIFGEPRHLRIGWLLPLVGVRFDLGPLGGLFVAVAGAVSIAVGVYAVGYAQREHWARFPLAVSYTHLRAHETDSYL